eukprot:CAMPEP_0194175630 /NCGR_PEP_ID=MMETSP0154-20130528/9636_1 /TAXON_ID=1049557 /ORGANISM="Thalassiothrix antarctica, Strain L6-D1" /LENGTH=372 /DNA_ID=CAMNT_0038889503 /DNA_START=125 /DNA_END=1239 /DNA_ORIENTATION=-
MTFRDNSSQRRKVSIDLGNGDCEWTSSYAMFDHIGNARRPFGTLFASYPGAGMRIAWQQTEGVTGIEVRDDFFRLSYPKLGLVKTQYPHYEGIWSYGENMDQVVLVIRNPRWNIPSYHTLLSELNYAHTWELAYDELPNVFTKRAPMEDWIKWRDYRYSDEINLWGMHIDYWMENGTKYWEDYDFERNGQYPFKFLNKTEQTKQDYNCAFNCDCIPKVIVSYEHLKNPITGPDQLKKIAGVLRGKRNMTVIEDEAINCVWHDTWIHTPAPSNAARDKNGLPAAAYNFTIVQMETMEAKLIEYRDKYSSGIWIENSNAQYLVENFEEYLTEVSVEIAERKANPQPTPAPYAGYAKEIQDWYNSKGKGNRYDKA